MYLSCYETWQQMTELSHQDNVRNFSCHIDMSNYVIETELFPIEALQAYSQWNLEKSLNKGQEQFFNNTRGGGQGDYREGMSNKIQNVVSCLNGYHESKRALITICNNPYAQHTNDNDAKCMREIHFYIDNNSLNASVFFRAQAALIFPKNIHFIGSLMAEVATQLEAKPKVGKLHYLTSILVSDRS